MERYGKAPEQMDFHDVALMQEIRTMIRSLPESQRTGFNYNLSRNGDRTALRAVLSAPNCLSGVDEALITSLILDVLL